MSHKQTCPLFLVSVAEPGAVCTCPPGWCQACGQTPCLFPDKPLIKHPAIPRGTKTLVPAHDRSRAPHDPASSFWCRRCALADIHPGNFAVLFPTVTHDRLQRGDDAASSSTEEVPD